MASSDEPVASDIAASNNATDKRSLRARNVVTYNEERLSWNVIHFEAGRPAKRSRSAEAGLDEASITGNLESETAWAVNLNGYSVTEEEEGLLPLRADEKAYVKARNYVLTRWRKDVSSWLSEDEAVSPLSPRLQPYARVAWRFLTSMGYINTGVAPDIVCREVRALRATKTVIVIGAGLAGLAAARQLTGFGFKVVVLEGRGRPGGRVYSKKLQGQGVEAVGDLGGSIITGIDGNPLSLLARQLGIPLYEVDSEKVPLYYSNGKQPSKKLDDKITTTFNDLLDELSRYRDEMGEITDHLSVGHALEVLCKEEDLKEEELKVLQWHVANLEFANAQIVSNLSMRSWDQDDPYEFLGSHVFLPGGNMRIIKGLAEGLPIFYNSVVRSVRYSKSGVAVDTESHTYLADAVVVTVPLGVLKKKAIQFVPPLPQRKQDAIDRLGFGVLNKVVMLFPEPFWGDNDMFGYISDKMEDRGQFFLFYQYAQISGGPLLIALVSGEAALRFESTPAAESVEAVMKVLRTIFEKQGVKVPPPVQAICTRWGADPMSYGSYSNLVVGSLGGEDYDILAEHIGGRLFFAGEATTRKYPATMHGAYVSGLREAANVAANLAKEEFFNHESAVVRVHGEETGGSSEAVNSISQSTALVEAIKQIFDDPAHPLDVEFGCFQVVHGPADTHFENSCLLRLELGEVRGGARSRLPMFFIISKEAAAKLRDVAGGDEARINFLANVVDVKLVGRQGQQARIHQFAQELQKQRSGGVTQQQPASDAVTTNTSTVGVTVGQP